MWKAFEELEALGWITSPNRPRIVSVQAAGCAPIGRAFAAGATTATPWTGAHTIADGLRVPSAIGDFLILRALRRSGGTAVAVSDADMISGMRDLGRHEGISAAPGGGATLSARGDRPGRPRGAIQYCWGTEVSGVAGRTVSVIVKPLSAADLIEARSVPERHAQGARSVDQVKVKRNVLRATDDRRKGYGNEVRWPICNHHAELPALRKLKGLSAESRG